MTINHPVASHENKRAAAPSPYELALKRLLGAIMVTDEPDKLKRIAGQIKADLERQ